MLISMIRDKKNNYYVNLERKNDIYYYHVICANNESTSYMTNEEISKLFKKIFDSNLSYLRKEGEYNIYLDEANNQRYFKDGKENLMLFLEKNGTPAILYMSKNDGNSKYQEMKNYMMKIDKNKFYIITTTALYFILASINIMPKENHDYFINNYSYETSLSQESTKISLEEIQQNIISSSDKTLSTIQRNYLANTTFINDVVEVSDISRNYILRQKTKDINLSYFSEEEKKEHPNRRGYYTLKDINTIHLWDNSSYIFHYAGAHEFIHLLQDNNQYSYIREASAEIMKYEYFHEKAESYLESRKRLYVLMEMIGPKPVMECNFKGDTSTFEEAIHKNLEEKEAEELLDLFTKSPAHDKDTKSTNKKIDILLAKMYKNITGKDMDKDVFMNHIYNSDKIDRVYFNQKSSKFYQSISIGGRAKGTTTKYDYEKIKDSGYISKYIYVENKKISESEYKSFISSENNYVYALYIPKEGYYMDLNQIVSDDKTERYSIETAISKNLIEKTEYRKKEEYLYNSLEELYSKHDMNVNCYNKRIQVLFTNGEIGELERSYEKDYIIKVNYVDASWEDSIAEKFPDQVKKKVSPSYKDINSNELDSMIVEFQRMKSIEPSSPHNKR